MIHRRYGNANPHDPQIARELKEKVPLEQITAGKFLGLDRTETPRPNPGSGESSSEGSKQTPPKQEKDKQQVPDTPARQRNHQRTSVQRAIRSRIHFIIQTNVLTCLQTQKVTLRIATFPRASDRHINQPPRPQHRPHPSQRL